MFYYRNYNDQDTKFMNLGTSYSNGKFVGTNDYYVSQWVRNGQLLDNWNTSRDGTGTAYYPSELYPSGVTTVYAIWRDIRDYTTNDTELKSIADAIRDKGSTYLPLVYPSGFVSAIEDLPDINNWRKVVSRTVSAFSDNMISKIGSCAFYYCMSLKEVNLPNCSVVSASAFQACTILRSVNLPICSEVGNTAFSGCYALDKLDSSNFPNLQKAGQYAFADCGASSINLPALSSIVGYTFTGCSKLSYVSLPAFSFMTVGGYVFSACSSLTEVHLDNFNVSATTANNVGSGMFRECYKLESISLPKLTRLAPSFFLNCSLLSNVSLPSCSLIGTYAFYSCNKLSNISLPECTTIHSSAFISCRSLETIYAPKTETIMACAFSDCRSLKSIDFPVVSMISSSAFLTCYELSVASLGSSLTNIGNTAFRSCYNLISVYIYGSNVPTLTTNAAGLFYSTPIGGYTTSTGGVYGSVYVPASLVDTYKTEQYWSYIADRITSIPE